MRFDDSNVDTSSLDDRRGGRGGGGGKAAGIGLGGLGIVGIIGALLWALLGGDPTPLLQGSGAGGQTTSDGGQAAAQDVAASCRTEQDLQANDECFVLKVFNETNEVWADYFSAQGSQYRNPKLVYYDRAVATGGCGNASSSAGPFYCPPDQRVYIDLNFLNQLQRDYGFSGRYAQAYIVAHEVGHHIQNITGTEGKVRQLQQANPRMANQYSVALELQADCLAGVWGRKANEDGNVVISQEEFNQALKAAAAVGDDAIMAGAGMRVNPEKFTHGSSEQRQQWFNRGFQAGDMSACNTFGS